MVLGENGIDKPALEGREGVLETLVLPGNKVGHLWIGPDFIQIALFFPELFPFIEQNRDRTQFSLVLSQFSELVRLAGYIGAGHLSRQLIVPVSQRLESGKDLFQNA